MKNNAILYGLIGLLGGSLLTILIAQNAVNSNNTGMMQMMGMRPANMMQEIPKEDTHGMGMGSSMEEMMESMEGKSGDDFDEAFMESMIIHHQGAIEMAKEAQKNAQHEEIKTLADNIIGAQTKEIDMMRDWQKTWGY
ncbi:DUF305 domain-containing protein [Candidatus Gottesmanbacteria bacterium]|nr:DUF305 domain-containing protein [Candidatus Gottesmanbacteria bacterium]